MKRFLINFCLATGVVGGFSSWGGTPEAFGPTPSENQQKWQDMETYAFIHYSLNTYTDQEWGYGDESPELFNPSDLDVKQWVKVCKDSGMKGIIFTAKHHCGFCMWPSAFTEYSVKNSPWKEGKGDVVRELADACREEGLKFAVYLSPWDRNHPEYGRDEYVKYFKNQLNELLTNYGDIFEVWFDGANGGDGWYGGANEIRKIDRTTYYKWPETYRMIRRIQPECLIWNNGSDRGDLRWVGTEAGEVGATNWSLLNNFPIMPNGRIHPTDSVRGAAFARMVKEVFKEDLAKKAKTDHPEINDGVRNTYWSPKDGANVGEVVLSFDEPVTFNRFVSEEYIPLGQRVKVWEIEAFSDGNWIPLKDALTEDGRLTTIGRKRIVCFPTVTTDKVRFRVTSDVDILYE